MTQMLLTALLQIVLCFGLNCLQMAGMLSLAIQSTRLGLELGRNGTVFICLMVPFLIVVLAALLDLSKDNSIYNRTVCAMGLHYLSAFTFDIGAFSSTNFMAIICSGDIFLTATYFCVKRIN